MLAWQSVIKKGLTVTGQYRTGDRHPVHNLMAFVEYDGNGVGWWTSIASDPEAAFRLAAASKLDRDCDRHDGSGTGGKSRDSHPQDQQPEDQSEHSSGMR